MSNAHAMGDPEELAALYAAGALPAEELAAFEQHLAAGCDDCVAQLQKLVGVAAALASGLTPVPPSADVRESLLKRVKGLAPRTETTSPLRDRVLQEAGQTGMTTKRATDDAWEKTDREGVMIRVLHVNREQNQFTALVRMAAGTAYPRHVHNGPEQCLVLEGDLHVGDDILRPGDFQHAPAGSTHGVQRTKQGCLLMITSSLTDEFVCANPSQ